MAKHGPDFYNVTITAVRNYEPGKGPPRKAQFWNFSQAVQSNSGPSGALAAMVDKFFRYYPNHAVVLPDGERGQKILTCENRSGVESYLSGRTTRSHGDIMLESADSTLLIKKMRALSGETPIGLTPKSEKEYDDALQGNMESYKWWQDPIVQMPAPIYVLDKAAESEDAPGTIRYKGRLYRRAAATSLADLPPEKAKALFFGIMEKVTEGITTVHQLLVDAGEQLQTEEGDATPLLADAAKRTYKEVLPLILDARDIAHSLKELPSE